MSTPHFSDSDVLGALNQKLDSVPGVNEVKSTVRVGDREVPISDTAGLQAAFDEYHERNRREIEGLKQINTNLQTRYAQPEQNAPPVQQNQQLNLPPGPQSWEIEDYVKSLQSDPVKTTEKALGKALGLRDGVSPTQVIQAIVATNAGLAQRLQQLEGGFQQSREEMESQRFLETHENWPGGNEAMNTLSNKLKQYNLPWTADNMHLAFLDAVSRGEIQPYIPEPEPQNPFNQPQGYNTNQSYNPYQNQQFSQPNQNIGVPSLRNSGFGQPPENDLQGIMQRLDQIPDTDKVLNIVKDLYRQSGQR